MAEGAHEVFDEMSIIMKYKQNGSVQEYYDRFVDLFKERIHEPYLIDIFIWMLKPEIKKDVSIFKPKSLHDACCLARVQEDTLAVMKRRTQIFDSKLSDSATCNKFNGDNVTDIVNCDAELVVSDVHDSLDKNESQLFNEQEIQRVEVADHDSEKDSSQELENRDTQINGLETGSSCRLGRSIAREIFTEDTNDVNKIESGSESQSVNDEPATFGKSSEVNTNCFELLSTQRLCKDTEKERGIESNRVVEEDINDITLVGDELENESVTNICVRPSHLLCSRLLASDCVNGDLINGTTQKDPKNQNYGTRRSNQDDGIERANQNDGIERVATVKKVNSRTLISCLIENNNQNTYLQEMNVGYEAYGKDNMTIIVSMKFQFSSVEPKCPKFDLWKWPKRKKKKTTKLRSGSSQWTVVFVTQFMSKSVKKMLKTETWQYLVVGYANTPTDWSLAVENDKSLKESHLINKSLLARGDSFISDVEETSYSLNFAKKASSFWSMNIEAIFVAAQFMGSFFHMLLVFVIQSIQVLWPCNENSWFGVHLWPKWKSKPLIGDNLPVFFGPVKLEYWVKPLDDDIDLENELEVFTDVRNEASTEVVTCVEVLIDFSPTYDSSIYPLTVNIHDGKSSGVYRDLISFSDIKAKNVKFSKPDANVKFYKEGTENSTFCFAQQGYNSKKLDKKTARDPHLFRFSINKGKFEIDEIYTFAQDDMFKEDLLILITHAEVFVWVGQNSLEVQRNEFKSVEMGMEFAECYRSSNLHMKILRGW